MGIGVKFAIIGKLSSISGQMSEKVHFQNQNYTSEHFELRLLRELTEIYSRKIPR